MTDAKSGQPRKLSVRLKRAGIIILVAGILAAGIVYWLGTRNNDLNNDPSMQGFNRAEQTQMGQLYGHSGAMIDDWADDLKQPGTQAILILIVSGLASAGCFYFARLVTIDEELPGS